MAAGLRPDTVLLLEHASVYTAGKRTEPQERPPDGTPVIDVDRGGKITWHGPGQLVGYPIVRLPEAVGVVDYVRRLEEAMIGLFAGYGLATGRVRGRSGVWLAADDEPAGAQDRRDRRPGRRRHDHARLRRSTSTRTWRRTRRIIPCGLVGVGVTSMAAELGRPVAVAEVAAALLPHLIEPAGLRAVRAVRLTSG